MKTWILNKDIELCWTEARLKGIEGKRPVLEPLSLCVTFYTVHNVSTYKKIEKKREILKQAPGILA